MTSAARDHLPYGNFEWKENTQAPDQGNKQATVHGLLEMKSPLRSLEDAAAVVLHVTPAVTNPAAVKVHLERPGAHARKDPEVPLGAVREQAEGLEPLHGARRVHHTAHAEDRVPTAHDTRSTHAHAKAESSAET